MNGRANTYCAKPEKVKLPFKLIFIVEVLESGLIAGELILYKKCPPVLAVIGVTGGLVTIFTCRHICTSLYRS